MGQQNAETIFNAAREISSKSERNGYLAGSCGNDVGLRSKVEALLKADSEAGSFLHAETDEHPSGSAGESGKLTMPFGSPREKAGQMIDRYKLLQPIGEGGFGSVWMAEQREPVKRRVALKIIKLGMDTKQVIARFDAERQALAMMDHPNIAKVLDAGATETGRPFFVMEYVKGIGILEYCDKEKLNAKDRLELFTSVCHAIQHAHQKGIIHRDIKPSNVLITLHDGVPVPKVIDFGIAKATNSELTQKTLFTEHHQMIGTPAYMSPEQAEMSGLDIDTRSDIYSLGVLLYELLTGTTPFDSKELASKGYAEMLRIILETEPHKPSTRLSSLGETAIQTASARQTDVKRLGSTLRGDLDWIVMKCLEKDRSRRYDTANGIAADIQRHLNDEPVQAGPPSATYRIRKFLHRNRTAVSIAAIVIISLCAGLTFLAFAWSEANKARNDLAFTNIELEEQRDKARESERIAIESQKEAEHEKEKSDFLRKAFKGEVMSVAVMPLDLVLQDPEHENQAAGMSRALEAELNKLHSLRVIPLDSVYRLHNADLSKTEIAKALKADLLLTSSVMQNGDQVQITMSLNAIKNDINIWANNYQGTWSELFDLQRRVSQDIVIEIELQLSKKEKDLINKPDTISEEASKAYAKGRENLRSASYDDLVKAITFFDEAIKLEPDYAIAYVGKAKAYIMMGPKGAAPLDTMPKAKEAACKAISIDDQLAIAWVVLGQIHLLFDWNWQEAEDALHMAVSLDPDLADTYAALGEYYVSIGQAERAVQNIRRAVELDPGTLLRTDATNYVPFMARDFDTVVELCKYAIDLDSKYWSPYAWMGIAMAWQGDIEGGLKELVKAEKLETNPMTLALLACVYAMDGQDELCNEKLDELIAIDIESYICPYEIATVFVALGDRKTAFIYLEKAIEAQSGCIPFMGSDPRMVEIRAMPEYQELMQDVEHPMTGVGNNFSGKLEDNKG